MADIGYITLLLALGAAIYSVFVYILGIRKKHPALLQSARNGLIAVCGLLSVSVMVMLIAILTHNFQIEYVASYTSRDMSLSYLLSALWAGNDGSLLFWAWLLSVFALIVVLQKRDVGKELVPWAAAVGGPAGVSSPGWTFGRVDLFLLFKVPPRRAFRGRPK